MWMRKESRAGIGDVGEANFVEGCILLRRGYVPQAPRQGCDLDGKEGLGLCEGQYGYIPIL
jgi:hypothetical protein